MFKVKLKNLFLTLIISILLLSGCAEEPANPPEATPQENEPDVVTTASTVDNAAAFKRAISEQGTWIIILTEDITLDEEIVLDGIYTNGKKDENGNDIIQRKVALYAQDENRNITERFTLTAPKFTINSPNASIQHGTFKGDLYVAATGFELIDTTVEGNVYFTNEEAQSTFNMDEESKITGKRELKGEEGE